MKTFFKIIVIMVLVFLLGGVGRVSWLCYKEPSLVRAFFAQTELTFKDESKEAVQWDPHHPKVVVHTVSIDDLMVEAYEQKRIADDLLCQEEHDKMFGLTKITEFVAGPTCFGGWEDSGVGLLEKASVSGEFLKYVNPYERVYIAWFMPGVNEDNKESPYDFPNVEKYLGGDSKKLKERIANTNIALRDYVAQVTYIDKFGNRITVLAEIIDRGPGSSTRFDGSRKLMALLGLTKHIHDSSPDNPEHRVKFQIRLIHKDNLKLQQLPSRELTMN